VLLDTAGVEDLSTRERSVLDDLALPMALCRSGSVLAMVKPKYPSFYVKVWLMK
jgi:hypothetical protein